MPAPPSPKSNYTSVYSGGGPTSGPSKTYSGGGPTSGPPSITSFSSKSPTPSQISTARPSPASPSSQPGAGFGSPSGASGRPGEPGKGAGQAGASFAATLSKSPEANRPGGGGGSGPTPNQISTARPSTTKIGPSGSAALKGFSDVLNYVPSQAHVLMSRMSPADWNTLVQTGIKEQGGSAIPEFTSMFNRFGSLLERSELAKDYMPEGTIASMLDQRAPFQYSPWNKKGGTLPQMALPTYDPIYQQKLFEAQQAIGLSRTPKDPTGGAVSFANIAESDPSAVEGWIKDSPITAKIGGHTFFKPAEYYTPVKGGKIEPAATKPTLLETLRETAPTENLQKMQDRIAPEPGMPDRNSLMNAVLGGEISNFVPPGSGGMLAEIMGPAGTMLTGRKDQSQIPAQPVSPGAREPTSTYDAPTRSFGTFDAPERQLPTVDAPERSLRIGGIFDAPTRQFGTYDAPERQLPTVDAPTRSFGETEAQQFERMRQELASFEKQQNALMGSLRGRMPPKALPMVPPIPGGPFTPNQQRVAGLPPAAPYNPLEGMRPPAQPPAYPGRGTTVPTVPPVPGHPNFNPQQTPPMAPPIPGGPISGPQKFRGLFAPPGDYNPLTSIQPPAAPIADVPHPMKGVRVPAPVTPGYDPLTSIKPVTTPAEAPPGSVARKTIFGVPPESFTPAYGEGETTGGTFTIPKTVLDTADIGPFKMGIAWAAGKKFGVVPEGAKYVMNEDGSATITSPKPFSLTKNQVNSLAKLGGGEAPSLNDIENIISRINIPGLSSRQKEGTLKAGGYERGPLIGYNIGKPTSPAKPVPKPTSTKVASVPISEREPPDVIGKVKVNDAYMKAIEGVYRDPSRQRDIYTPPSEQQIADISTIDEPRPQRSTVKSPTSIVPKRMDEFTANMSQLNKLLSRGGPSHYSGGSVPWLEAMKESVSSNGGFGAIPDMPIPPAGIDYLDLVRAAYGLA